MRLGVDHSLLDICRSRANAYTSAIANRLTNAGRRSSMAPKRKALLSQGFQGDPSAAVAVGDFVAARVAHDALGKLLDVGGTGAR